MSCVEDLVYVKMISRHIEFIAGKQRKSCKLGRQSTDKR